MKWSLLALCALSAVARGVPVQLDLREAALVHGKSVTVADVAAIEAADGEIAKSIGAVRIAAAPMVGYTENIGRAAVQAAVLSQPSTAGATLAWRGAERVAIRRAGVQVDGAAIAGAAQRYLESAFSGRYERLEAVPLGAPADVGTPEGVLALRPRNVALALRQRTPVLVDVFVDGTLYRSVAVPFRVQAWNTVLVARRNLPAGARLTTDDLGAERRDVLAEEGAPATAVQDWSGIRLRYPLDAGQVVEERHVVAADSVRQGDRVTLVLQTAGIRIETAAVAQQDGARGAAIRVKPVNGGDAVTARVKQADVVTVEGP